jgi:hypothetical protein
MGKYRQKQTETSCGLLSPFHALGIDLFLPQQGLNTTTPAGRAMFEMMGVPHAALLWGWE